MTIPSGFDRFVIERGQLLTDIEATMLGASFKIEVLDPLPS